MSPTSMVQGRIIAVQEMRFRLLTTDGRGFLFTLSHRARADASDLHRWHQGDNAVRVVYSGEPGLDSGVARAVDLL
ncbi:MAG TPA: hypothetical protein VIL85_05030 [Thermomicrobiales bacterium]|jgi:hypothetical protein